MSEEEFFQKCIKEQRFPRDDLEKQIILKKIMEKFEENKKYMESEVNEIIKEYYEDFSTIRRELINFGYMQRNVYTSEYWVLKKELTEEELDKIGSRQKHLKEHNVY
jgi:hypothetical protein